MTKQAIATGSTIEEAQAQALAELAAPAGADVQIEVIDLPVKKTLGIFGGCPAKVRAYYDDGKAEPVKTEKPASTGRTDVKEPEKKTEENRPDQTDKRADAKPIDTAKLPEAVKTAYDYLNVILGGLQIKGATVTALKSDDEYYFDIDSDDDSSCIIGRRGETLDSIQYLVRLVANRDKAENDYVRISLNVGNYRQKREETLKEIARKNAARVRKYGRNAVLDPMTPYERRIIHTEVAGIDGVTSHSVGSDNERKVVITLEDGVKATNPGGGYNSNRGGYNGNRGRGGYNNNRGGHGGYNNNNRSRSSDRPAAPSREPRSDVDGAAPYGKIK
jgi:spoIIIJ-associated protein